MRKLFGFAGLAIFSVITACGGGGGSPGDTKLPYSITLTAAKNQLPINIANQPPGIGVDAPYTTTLYVNAREGGAPIQGGKDIFGCNIDQGLDTGALAYLDGDPAHKVKVKNPDGTETEIEGLYRSVVLGANSGGNSFHFHAGDKAGTARITCTVTNPVDNQVSSASVNIVVGAATGKAASVIATAQAPGYLGTSNNTASLANNVGINVSIKDDANQPIPNPSAANLLVRIRPFGASAGARLASSGGSEAQVRTVNGLALVSLSSGPGAGVILLELVTDRADNDVSNGIQDPVTHLLAVSVHKALSSGPLVIGDATISVTNGMPYSYALTAQGGVPPYQWTSSGLPGGLTLSSDGIISGTPTAKNGTYDVTVTVSDDEGRQVSKNLSIKVEGEFAIDGCSSDVSAPCALPAGKVGDGYSYTLSFSIGDPAVAVTWTVTGSLPPGLVLAADGTISGSPTTAGTYTFIVTAKRGSLTVNSKVSIVVA